MWTLATIIRKYKNYAYWHYDSSLWLLNEISYLLTNLHKTNLNEDITSDSNNFQNSGQIFFNEGLCHLAFYLSSRDQELWRERVYNCMQKLY